MTKKNPKNHLKNPTNPLIDNYIAKFSKNERYYEGDKAISYLCKKFPKNKKIEEVFLKVCVINNLYSTNIWGTYNIAKHIVKLNIDKAIQYSNPDVVHKIAIGHGISKPIKIGDRNFYSFATKYCNWHNQKGYPIYDGFVHKILMAYQCQDPFSEFKNNDLKDAKKFKKIMNDFKDFYSLNKFNYKQLDKFLWLYGRELYKKTNN